MDEEEVAFQAFGIRNRRTFAVAFGIFLRRIHVAFLVNRVVGALVGHESDGDARVEDFGITEHAVQRLTAAAAPTGDADTRSINEGILAGEVLNAARLVLRGKSPDFSINTLAPFPSPWAVGSPVFDADIDIALINHILVPQIAARPDILDGRTCRLSINFDDDGIFLRRVEVLGLNHTGIKHQIAALDFDKLLGLEAECLILRFCFSIVFDDADRLMLRERNHVDDRRSNRVAEGMDCPTSGRRHIIGMLSGLVHRTEASNFTVAKKLRAVEITLGEVVRRGNEIGDTLLDIHADVLDIIEIALRNRDNLLPVAAHAVEVAPTVALAFPSEIFVILEPDDVVVRVEPSRIFVREDILRLGLTDGNDPDAVGILLAVHLLDKQFVAFGNEVHAGDVVVARVAGDIHPSRRASGSRDIADLHGRVGRARLRIGEMQDSRVEGIYIINNIEDACAFRVALPISDVFPIRTPAETVAASELFLIDPVESTIDNPCRTVVGKLRNLTGFHIFHIDVVLRNVGNPRPVGRELGEHQRSLGPFLAQLPECAGLEIQHPIVAPRIITPDAAGIVVD